MLHSPVTLNAKTLSPATSRLAFLFPSRLELVNEMMLTVIQGLPWQFPPSDRRFSIVLREMLVNAIVHGNRKEPERTVCCRVWRDEAGLLVLEVEDEGEGARPEAIDMSIPDDPAPGMARGFRLMAALTERIEFLDRGNRIRAIFRPSTEESH